MIESSWKPLFSDYGYFFIYCSIDNAACLSFICSAIACYLAALEISPRRSIPRKASINRMRYGEVVGLLIDNHHCRESLPKKAEASSNCTMWVTL